MPSIPIHPPGAVSNASPHTNALPPLLHTPSGLALLELQGTIHLPAPSEELQATTQRNESFATGVASPVGKLIFPTYSSHNPTEDVAWMKCVYLYVGQHQRLTGEVKRLPKPMGILRKRPKDNVDAPEELEIVEIVRHKIVFSQRPEPVGND